ncbi:hypothetical protein DVH24_014810, partial [Malus domestica]
YKLVKLENLSIQSPQQSEFKARVIFRFEFDLCCMDTLKPGSVGVSSTPTRPRHMSGHDLDTLLEEENRGEIGKESNSTLGRCSGDRRTERARGPVDRAPALGSPSEGGSLRARPMEDCQPCNPRWARAPHSRVGARQPTALQGTGPARQFQQVTVEKPRDFPRSVQSQRLFNMSCPI